MAYEYPMRDISELQQLKGIYFPREITLGGAFRTRERTGLRDLKTGAFVFMGYDALCGLTETSRKAYAGKDATVWFAPSIWPNTDEGIVYQLEVDGAIVCSIDSANKKAADFNVRNKTMNGIYPILSFIGLMLVAAFAAYWDYVKRKGVPNRKENGDE